MNADNNNTQNACKKFPLAFFPFNFPLREEAKILSREIHGQWNDNDTIAATANNVIKEGEKTQASIGFCCTSTNIVAP